MKMGDGNYRRGFCFQVHHQPKKFCEAKAFCRELGGELLQPGLFADDLTNTLIS